MTKIHSTEGTWSLEKEDRDLDFDTYPDKSIMISLSHYTYDESIVCLLEKEHVRICLCRGSVS